MAPDDCRKQLENQPAPIMASGVNAKVIDHIAKKFRRSIILWMNLIDASFLPADFKKQYKRLILKRVLMLR